MKFREIACFLREMDSISGYRSTNLSMSVMDTGSVCLSLYTVRKGVVVDVERTVDYEEPAPGLKVDILRHELLMLARMAKDQYFRKISHE